MRMRQMRSLRLLALFGLVLAPGLDAAPAAAAGLAQNEQSARVMGMGGAFVAVADSPGTLFYNPAGLVQLDGLKLELGVTLLTPSVRFQGVAPAGGEAEVNTVRPYTPLPSAYVSYRVHDRVAVGLGVYMPYGQTVQWPEAVDAAGARVSWWGRDLLRRASLKTFFVTPTIGVKLHRRVLLGLGFSVVQGAVTLERSVTFSADAADDVQLKLSGDDVAVSASAGLLVQVLPELLHLGLTFRSGVDFTFAGTAVYSRGGDGAGVPAGLRTQLIDGPVSAELSLPHTIGFGLAAFPFSGLTLGLAVEVVTWSSFDRLVIQHGDLTDESGAVTRERGHLDMVEPKLWHNSVTLRLGAEYELLRRNLPVRLGFAYDQSPVPEATVGPGTPDASGYHFSLGMGYRLRGFTVDLAYQYRFSDSVKSTAAAPLPGTYQTSAHLLALSLGYALDI